MKINDIDYEHYQGLLRIKEAFENELNSAKFIKFDYGVYIRTTERDLLDSYKNMADAKEYWGSAIQAYCHEKGIQFSEFVTKYGMKK